MRYYVIFLITLLPLCLGASAQNTLLFTIDSCRADRFGVYGYSGNVTPHIDEWAQTGTVFKNAYSVSAWTAPGLVSILSGLYPPVHGVNNRDNSGSPDLITLLKIFQRRDYRVPNLNFFTFAPYYRNLGLAEVQRQYFGPRQGEELLNWLSRNSGTHGGAPFFLWYHTTIVHQPYNPEQEDLPAPRAELEKSPGIKAVLNGAIVPVGSARFTESDKKVLDRLYDAEMRRMDRLFKDALDILKGQGMLEKTLIVLTADHGEELLDHGFVGHASTSLQAKLFEEVLRIPLIFSWPAKVPQGRIEEQRVSQIDIFPTVLALHEVPLPGPVHGVDLFSGAIPDRPLYFESVLAGNQTVREHQALWVRAILRDNSKYISSEELYDLAADPRETVNLVEEKKILAAELRSDLDGWIRVSQAERRRRFPSAPAPAAGQGERECPVIFSPQNGKRLEFDIHTGALLLDWSGSKDTDYIIQYDIGVGDVHVAGVFEVKGNHQIVGPLGAELWGNLQAWNPFRIRVAAKRPNPCWSEWTEFSF